MPGQPQKPKFKVDRGKGLPQTATNTMAARRAERSAVGLIPIGAPVVEDGSAGTTVFAMISPERLADNPDNDASRLVDLSDLASVGTVGILQPLLVVPTPIFLDAFPQHAEAIGDHPYVIQAGHRRKRRALQDGLAEVPIYVRTDMSRNGNDSIVRVLENIARVNLNPITEALEYQRLRDEYGMAVTQIADKLGFNHPRISKRLQLLELPAPLQVALVAGATEEDVDLETGGKAPRRLMISEALELRKERAPEVMLAAWKLMQADDNLNVHAALAQAPKTLATGPAPQQRAGDGTGQETGTVTAPQDASAARYLYCEKLISMEPDSADVLQVLAHHSLDGAPSHREAIRLAHRWLVKAGVGPADLRQPAAYIAAVGAEHIVRVAYAVAVAADEVRLRNPNRAWDRRDAAYLARLQAIGYTPTAWENDRLAAVTH